MLPVLKSPGEPKDSYVKQAFILRKKKLKILIW